MTLKTENELQDFINVNSFNVETLNDFEVIKNKIYYINTSNSFDIETSSFYKNGKKYATMYIWQINIDNVYIYGRTWQELIDLLYILMIHYSLNDTRHMIIYIHNESFEFQFMHKYFNMINVFARQNRKVIKAITDIGIEFKCSYALSGYSLAKVAENLSNIKIKKLVGDLDYKLLRTSITKMTDEEMMYCLYDVKILHYYILECIERFGDISNIPLTKTGIVRRYVRERMKKEMNYIKYNDYLKKLIPNNELFNMLQDAFMGGYTHANYLYVRQVIPNVKSKDISSSYPFTMCCDKFPMETFKYSENSFENICKRKNEYAMLIDVCFYNIESINYNHIISSSKCKILENGLVDNGRVEKASIIKIIVTDLDFFNIIKFYKYDDLIINKVLISRYGRLPKTFVECVLKLFGDKTKLKGIKGKEKEYLHGKEDLNSCFGMSVTSPLNDNIVYINGEWYNEGIENIDTALKNYYNSKNVFLPYQWGVWVTANARNNLLKGIYIINDKNIYDDTDSIKYIDCETANKFFVDYNNNVLKKIQESSEYYNLPIELYKPKTIKGEEKILGNFEDDGIYKRFKTLGAKRYFVEKENGDFEITVSGCNKEKTLQYLLNKSKKENIDIFELFDDGLEINNEDSGKMCLTYIDKEFGMIVTDYQGNKSFIHEKSYIHAENTTFSLSLASNFIEYLAGLKYDNVE